MAPESTILTSRPRLSEKNQDTVGPFFSVCVGLNQVSRQQYREICRTSRFHITEWVRWPPPSTWWLRHPRHMQARSRHRERGTRGLQTRERSGPEWLNQPHRTSQASATRKTGKQSSWVLRKRKWCTQHPLPHYPPLAHNPSCPQPLAVTHTLPLCVLLTKPCSPQATHQPPRGLNR